MTATAVRTTAEPRSVPAALRARLESERRAVTEEIDAFDAFVDRIQELPAEAPTPADGVRGIGYRSGGSGLERVKAAYEETVMCVSHYDQDYGDTYRESVVTEFGPEIGGALTDGPRFQPHLKQAILGKARSCRADRESFLETLETESESVDAVGGELDDIEAELRGIESGSSSSSSGSGSPSRRGYGALEAEWRRLDVLADDLDGLATARQRAIIRQRREFTIPSSAPDIPTYLYDGFDDHYPLLSFCVDLRRRVQREKAERERGLAEV